MSDELPEHIGKYQIIRQIGKGATSQVFLGVDPLTEQQVAIKLINFGKPQDARSAKVIRKLLLTEVSLAGKLQHPHIVAIYDAAITGDGGYLAMEYVAGGTLERHISADTLLPIAGVVEIVFKCCKALDYAYRNGVIHRDIKPANILMGGPNTSDIKVSDFGAAQVLFRDSTQISRIGSPLYMSPQQAAEESPLNHQTDIFSLGVVMYQLLCGKLPFNAKSLAAMLYQIIHVDPPAPSTFRPEIPASLDRIVAKMLQKTLVARYLSWDELTHDLAAVGAFAVDERNIADSEKFSLLREMNFFDGFDDVELWEVLHISYWNKYPPRKKIIEEGGKGDSFYMLAGGEVKILKDSNLITTLKAGDCFGEMAYLSRPAMPRSASVETVGEVTVMEISAEALDRASENCQLAFNKAFLNILVQRLHHADIQMTNMFNAYKV